MKAPIKNKTGPYDCAGVPARVQKPADAYGHGDGHWQPGQLPMGGYRSVIPFNQHNEKTIPTSKPQKNHKVTR